MTATIHEYVARVRELLPQVEYDLDALDATDAPSGTIVVSSLSAALLAYSRHRPRHRLVDYTGDGSSYEFTLPADFVADFSKVISVEYPQGERTPVYLSSRYYSVHFTLSGATEVYVLRLAYTPSASETVRLRYTTLHTITESATTVPAGDFEGLCHLACHYLAMSAVGYFGSQSRSTLDANVLNYRTKADEWRAIAEQFLYNYKSTVGLGRLDTVPAGGVIGFMDRPDSVFREE